MAVSLPRSLVEYILLGPTRDRRQLQDSPVLADVWIEFAKDPENTQELLITPDWNHTSAEVAIELDEKIDEYHAGTDRPVTPNIAYLQGVVAARLYFDELLRILVPMTVWWVAERNVSEMKMYLSQRKTKKGEENGDQRLTRIMRLLATMMAHWSAAPDSRAPEERPTSFDRYVMLAGVILWARQAPPETDDRRPYEVRVAEAIATATTSEMRTLLGELLKSLRQAPAPRDSQTDARQGAGPANLVYEVSLNRPANLAIARSVQSVKGDAARSLFSVDASEIGWAVLDSGIQGNHKAFRGRDGKSRVKGTFDFGRYRRIVSMDNRRLFRPVQESEKQDPEKAKKRADAIAKAIADLITDDLFEKPTPAKAEEYLAAIARDLTEKQPLRWENIEPFVRLKADTPPRNSHHGTHVAGIIGARKPREGEIDKKKEALDDYADGMCPNINLYDFRVIADSEKIKDTEFSIIAALQYVRYMNDRHDYRTIHGANLSLSIPHDVHNFACGRTPICEECEALVDSGVVVVAAAGNLGYEQTKDGSAGSYAAFTVTDPGNADGVITVGSTHRTSPHTYGVSFFSSRGPTGDGRQKPDLVAPGEKIRGPIPGGWGDLDGTSMSAPHVSGAAAMVMARYPEMRGNPRKIKRILCESATDLGRERNFQGHGMLDVLRALQSI